MDNNPVKKLKQAVCLYSSIGQGASSFDDNHAPPIECLKLKRVIDCNDSSVIKMDEDEDFCICRKCRSISGSFSSNANAYSYTPRSRTHTRQQSLANAIPEHYNDPYVRVRTNIPIDNNSGEPDDEPLLLNETCDLESAEGDHAKEHCHVQKGFSMSLKRARNKLIISSILCLIFMIAEVIGGYMSHSLAIMTDAAHMLSDLTSFLISLFALWVGQKSPTKKMSFGFFRAEILGAIVSVMLIWVLTGVLVYLAVGRVINPDYEIDADIMLIVSAAGVAMNIVMGIVLHGSCCGGKSHGHSHGLGGGSHSHGEEEGDNINVRAAFIHVIGDLIQSLGVMVAAYIIRYKPEYKLADPICTFIFSIMVLFTTIAIMRDALHVLMEGFPRNLNYANIKDDLQEIDGVRMAHSLHIWSLTVDKNAAAVHLAVDNNNDPYKILLDAQMLLRKKYQLFNNTIQVEPYNPETMLECKTCLGPPL